MDTINLTDIEIPIKITPEYILNKVDDIQIYRNYIGKFELGKKIKNPFRQDTHPSFSLYIGEDSLRLKWKDFATNEGGDCFTLVSKLFGLNFNQSLEKIAEDFGLLKNSKGVSLRQLQAIKVFKENFQKKEFKIQIESRPYTEEELAYWNQYSITKQDLISYNILPIKKLWFNGKIFNLNSNLHFAYYFKSEEKFKIYSPNDPDTKWFGNISTKYIEGLERKFDFTKPIIITKSRKDRISLSKMFPDSNIVNSQNEAETSIPIEKDEFFNKFSQKVVFFDKDQAGINANKKLNSRGYGWINIPQTYKAKDPADLIVELGFDEAKRVICEEFKKKGIPC